MSSAGVIVKEFDLSTRVPEFPGVYGGIVIPATKGPVLTPTLITNESQLLKVFTPDERVEVGYDLSYYSALAFLQKSNKLWVVRPDKTDRLIGGLAMRTAAGVANSAIGTGVTSVDGFGAPAADQAYTLYQANPGVWGNRISVMVYTLKNMETATINAVANTFTAAQTWETGYPVQLVSGSVGATLPANLSFGTTYYVINTSGTLGLASSLANAVNGTALTFGTAGSGTIKIKPYKEFVKETDSIVIEVYKTYNNVVSLVETWTVSRVSNKKDGNGRNIYIEDVLAGSLYIRCKDNKLIGETTALKGQLSPLFITGGSDGAATITDNQMITAADMLANSEDKPVTLLMDGGWSTSAYQLKLIALAESRQDCIAVLSTPVSAETSADYLNSIIDYRKTTLNANSSFAAMYTPSCKIFDKFNDRSLYVSPDGYAAAALSATASNYEIWYPTAGFKRGMLLVNDLRRRFSKGEMDLLYDAGINPLRFAPGRGILIWGQKTLLARPSALDRLNVRCLLIVIEPAVKVALEDFLFEINNKSARAVAKALVTAYMNGIKARKGVDDFYVVCDDTNNLPSDVDNYIMNLHLFVKPSKAIEYIPFTTVITSSSITFSLAQQMVFG